MAITTDEVPAPDLSLIAGDGYVVAVDLGGTKIMTALFGPTGEIVGRKKKSTGKNHEPAVLIARIAECVRQVVSEASLDISALRAVGIGAPGTVDFSNGVVHHAPNLGWHDVPLKAELERQLGVPVAVDNDVRVAVRAEHAVGIGRGVDNMVGIWPGTGVGGGIVVDGQVMSGATNSAGELGHITVKAGGPLCGCGGRGHLEALASRTAIVKYIAKKVSTGESTTLQGDGGDLGKVRSEALAKAYTQGDKLVSKAINRAARYLSIGIASIANTVNPELVVIGGGLVEALGQPFVDRIADGVRGQPMIAATENVRIVASSLGDDAGAVGAALIARRLANATKTDKPTE